MYWDNEKQEILKHLDQEITNHEEQLHQIKNKNKRKENKLPPQGDTLFELISLVAETELLQQKKEDANKICFSHYEIEE